LNSDVKSQGLVRMEAFNRGGYKRSSSLLLDNQERNGTRRFQKSESTFPQFF
jgi:hypothetical protein